MMLSDIQQIITPQVFEHISKALEGYFFNVNTDFFIRSIDNHCDHWWLTLRSGVVVSMPKVDDYTSFCERILILWNEQEGNADLKRYENEYPTRKAQEDQHYYCRGCGKTFSGGMNFKKDGFGRNICPICDSRKIDIQDGEVDDFYD